MRCGIGVSAVGCIAGSARRAGPSASAGDAPTPASARSSSPANSVADAGRSSGATARGAAEHGVDVLPPAFRPPLGQGRKLHRHLPADDAREVACAERRLPGRQLVGRRRQRVDVGGRADGRRPAIDLFRRHVLRRADHHRSVRQRSRRHVHQPSHAEVQDLDRLLAADARQHHVGRLDVAMHDAVGVRPVEHPGVRSHDRCDARRGQHAVPPQNLLQIPAFQELHPDLRAAVRRRPVVQHRHDARTPGPGAWRRLLPDAPQHLRRHRAVDPGQLRT